MGLAGAPGTAEAEDTLYKQVLTAQTTDLAVSTLVAGLNGAQVVEVQKTGAGTANIILSGSNDGLTFYPVGYWQVDNIASPVRAVAVIALAAGVQNHVFQVLDVYRFLQVQQQGTAGAVAVNAWIFAVPE